MTIEVKGLDEVINKLDKMEKVIKSQGLKNYIAEEAIKVINKIAEERLSQSGNYIKNNKYEITNEGILIYNDSKTDEGQNYSLIIEYGSGTYAEMEHIGQTPEFIESGYEWWYGFGKNIKVHGQSPKHIYNDAAKEIQKNISKWASEYIGKEIK